MDANNLIYFFEITHMCAILFWYRRYIIVVQMAHIYKNFPANFEEFFF